MREEDFEVARAVPATRGGARTGIANDAQVIVVEVRDDVALRELHQLGALLAERERVVGRVDVSHARIGAHVRRVTARS